VQKEPPLDQPEEQALATFNHATEQRRFLRGQQWTITYYALTAYGALAVAPSLVELGFWRFLVSVLALLLVWAAFTQAWRLLAEIQLELEMELKRLHAAQGYLSLIRAIHRQYPLKELSQRRRRRRERVKWRGFQATLFLGAIFAILIILSLSWPDPASRHRGPWPALLLRFGAVVADQLDDLLQALQVHAERVHAVTHGQLLMPQQLHGLTLRDAALF
jgi:hypothetical protein